MRGIIRLPVGELLRMEKLTVRQWIALIMIYAVLGEVVVFGALVVAGKAVELLR